MKMASAHRLETASTTLAGPALEADIDAWLASCYADPLRYVLWAWDWGHGELAGEQGPKPWQRQFLLDLGRHISERQFNGSDPVAPIKMAVSSGVGPGKTALLAWLLHFLEDTRPDCKCRVTANTVTQLDTATWAEVRKWGLLKLTAERWHTTMEGMYHVGDRTNWFAVRTTCAPENAQAFAGWHNKRSTTANFYDEGGTIPDEIFEKGRGIEMDGEPFQFIFGQCSRRSGQLYRAVFGSEQDQWDARVINGYDVATSPVTQALYKEWEETYGGPDSDYCRVHIRGLPPNADELQYIDHARVVQAQTNKPYPVPDEPLVVGVDVSGGGSAWTVARFRRGLDARTIPPLRLTGEQTIRNERALPIAKLAEILSDQRPSFQVTAMFVDSAFGSPIVARLRQMGFDNVFEVVFGGDPLDDKHDHNLRASIYRRMKEWLPKGAIDATDQRLADALECPGFHLDKKDRLVIESKADIAARGGPSLDDSDALGLTFAQIVRIKKQRVYQAPLPSGGDMAWGV